MLDLVRQQTTIREALNGVISKVIEEAIYISDEDITPFEQKLATFCNRSHAVGINSGTAALQLALIVSGIRKGSEVITVPNSFFATTEAIIRAGAIPRFVDIDRVTHLMSLPALKAAINERTSAILPVHLFGNVVDVRAIQRILRDIQREDVIIIEDCAHAIGAAHSGQPVPIGGMGAFSFNPGKNIGALSDAGAIVVDHEDRARQARLLRDHGRGRDKNEHLLFGMNARLGRLNDRVLALKMDYLAHWNAGRRSHASQYDSAFANLKCVSPAGIEPEVCASRHQYVIRCDRRDELRKFLDSNGVATGIHYPRLITDQEPLRQLGYGNDLPNAEALTHQIVSLPCFAELHKAEVNQVIELVQEFDRRCSDL